jgi:hypothetical protein
MCPTYSIMKSEPESQCRISLIVARFISGTCVRSEDDRELEEPDELSSRHRCNRSLLQRVLPNFDNSLSGLFWSTFFAVFRSSFINFRIIYPRLMACSKEFHKLCIPRKDVHCDVDREPRNLPELYDFSRYLTCSPSFLSILAFSVLDGKDDRAIFSSFL